MALIRWHTDFSSPVCYYCEVGKRSCVKDVWEKKEKNKKGKKKCKVFTGPKLKREESQSSRNGTSKQFRRKVSVCIPTVVPLCHYHPWSVFLTSAANYYSKCFCFSFLFLKFYFQEWKKVVQGGRPAEKVMFVSPCGGTEQSVIMIYLVLMCSTLKFPLCISCFCRSDTKCI